MLYRLARGRVVANLESISYSAVPGYRMERSELEREGVQNAIADVSERADNARS